MSQCQKHDICENRSKDSYDHLKVYKDYKIETEIIHENREGNKLTSLGKDSITFRPAKVDETDTANGVVKSEVQIDTSKLNGGTLHAVDTFYVKVEDNWVKLLTHNRELNDERQKVFVPYMETTASDSKTNDHVGTIEKEAEIHDIVTYENLANDRMYKLVGTLRYADSSLAEGPDLRSGWRYRNKDRCSRRESDDCRYGQPDEPEHR